MRCGEDELALVERLVKCGQVGSMERLEAFRRNVLLSVSMERDLCLEAAGLGVLTQERRIDGLIVRLERVEVLDGLGRLRLSSGA